jgi:hypothetical protein
MITKRPFNVHGQLSRNVNYLIAARDSGALICQKRPVKWESLNLQSGYSSNSSSSRLPGVKYERSDRARITPSRRHRPANVSVVDALDCMHTTVGQCEFQP